MDSVTIQSVDLLESVDLYSLAKLYQTVYAAPPWREYKKCSHCDMQWGIDQIFELEQLGYSHCGSPVVDYWSEEYLFGHFKEISSKPLFSGALALDNNRIVGFAWGYELDIARIDEDLGFPGLSQKLKKEFGEFLHVAYLADLATDSNYRRLGLGKELTRARHESLSIKGATVALTRTKGGEEASITHRWYDKIGFSIFAEYHDKRSRVIRAIEMNRLHW